MHSRQEEQKCYDLSRGAAADRGYDRRWRLYAKQFLRRHPLCVRCDAQGIARLAELVDHIIPVKNADDPRFWDSSNHAGLCRSCHAIKTREENKERLALR